MKKALVLLFLFPILMFSQPVEKKMKFIDADLGELWRIDDEWTRVYDKPDFTYDDWRYIFRNKLSLIWFDLFHTKAFIYRFKYVRVLAITGFADRWKFVKYGVSSKEGVLVRHGWILATTVEEATKRK